MKFSENWLRQHVKTSATRDELAATLTAIGLEVEEMTVLGDALDGVVVARIVECAKHPEADKLQVCQVDAGALGVLQIVCGAPNARPGLVAPLATIGTKIGDLTIKAAKLRGVESNGMLCSAKELGIDADASGLLELPADAPVGAPLADYLGLPDARIELKLTPNRADCFGVHGIAFDVAAATGCDVEPLDTAPVPAAHDAVLPVELNAGADAPRFVGRVLHGVDARAATPVWMAERLRRSGVRPVSFLVDVTQYLMLELGQPMHAYDRDLLQGPIGVRAARDGETLTLLNGSDATVGPQFLVITDADRAVGLAGVMGGEDTKVSSATRNVFLEAAHFAPSAIIGRSRKLGLHTDAGHRFERGVDPELPRIAVERATRLIMDVAGGTPGPVIEAVLPEHLPRPQPIELRRARLARVLGTHVADAEVARILSALGLSVETTTDGWRVTAPARRFDLAIEEDLVEEIARIHGYDAIPTTLPGGATRLVSPSETRSSEHDARRQLVARDYLEAINYAFVDADLLATWQLADGGVALANPLSAELGVMRTRLLPGLVAALGRNAARQQSRIRLFEIGKTFAASSDAPIETRRIAAVAGGDAAAEQWGEAARKLDFHDIKGDLDSLAALSGATLEYRASTPPFAHPGRSADVYRDGACIGWIGQLHPRLQQALDLDADVYGFELALDALQARALPRATGLSKYPSVRRDLAFVVPERVSWDAMRATAKHAAGEVLRELRLFDRYAGKGVENGFKSLAMALILQDESRTLIDRDVDAVVADVVAALKSEHDAVIRS
ncbi:MAG TPA: phenylalanine--tRNA ligase subunit beta [Thermomonas sp.]|jgi:phenylalanyl-tRNA synthetase beta chain|uniref:phenylalanine--tRNA ligase subunit beta n=1 Tax=Thermomonas sp. TaxID=1971895 RepID=UPI002C3B1906|nr:phenylalanine--tRNA ligase subunit beta [Thermomonas sp.]HPM56266.1 phenylalanine--tRNA ligase subunit beta [Thermomonas sp.]HPW12343.1 phenylalanine--tRNA ligase subunit beta [Thermomonas sp.]